MRPSAPATLVDENLVTRMTGITLSCRGIPIFPPLLLFISLFLSFFYDHSFHSHFALSLSSIMMRCLRFSTDITTLARCPTQLLSSTLLIGRTCNHFNTMQQYFVKSLVGFLVIAVVSRMATGNSLAFLRALAQDVDDEPSNYDDVEQTNSITDYDIKYTPTNKKNKDWVKVKLAGSLHSHVLSQGQNYELTCKADGGPAPKIFWHRGGNLQKKIEELKRDFKFDEFATSGMGAAKLERKYIIDCASKEDEGPIHCVAIAGQEVKVESTVILVNENSTRGGSCGSKRSPVITHSASTVLALQGSAVILPCRATGKPEPYVTWETAEGSRITNYLFNPRYKVLPSGDLLIDSLEWSDMNGYTCIARSNLGEDRTSTFIYPVQRDERR